MTGRAKAAAVRARAAERAAEQVAAAGARAAELAEPDGPAACQVEETMAV